MTDSVIESQREYVFLLLKLPQKVDGYECLYREIDNAGQRGNGVKLGGERPGALKKWIRIDLENELFIVRW